MLDEFKMFNVLNELRSNLEIIKKKSRVALLSVDCKDALGFFVEGKDLRIHFCPAIFKQTPNEIAQILIHEGVHAMGVDNECKTTAIELTAALLGGMRAFPNGYIAADSRGVACSYGFDKNWVSWFNQKMSFRKSDDVTAWKAEMGVRVTRPKDWDGLGIMQRHVNQLGPFGTTPLMEAAKVGSVRWIKALLKLKGVNLELKSFEEMTAYDYAKEAGHDRAAKLLVK